MLNMDQKLIKRQEEGKIIKTGIVGAGQMGRGNGNTDGTDERYHTSHRI